MATSTHARPTTAHARRAPVPAGHSVRPAPAAPLPRGPFGPAAALALQPLAGNAAVSRLVAQRAAGVQRYAVCKPARPSTEDCPARHPGEAAAARTGPMELRKLTIPATGETGALITGFDIGASDVKSSLAADVRWRQFLADVPREKSKWKLLGFTDCAGADAGNTRLRDARAGAVQASLPAPVRAQITSVAGAPLEECITENWTPDERTQNRSVAVILTEATADMDPTVVRDRFKRQRPNTKGCSDEQKQMFDLAYPLAQRMGRNAIRLLGGMTRGSKPERVLAKFFGPDAFAFRDDITDGYKAALGAFTSNPTMECVPTGTDPCESSGTQGYSGAHAIAFGTPIVVCSQGFTDGPLELADTILHEASHVGDWTYDLEYCDLGTGCSKATTLPVGGPINMADIGLINNADSYARFASETWSMGF